MGFTTTTFLFVFLPLVMAVYFAFYRLMKNNNSRIIARNIVLVIFSYFFYAWALQTTAIMLLGYTLVIYLVGLWIGAVSKTKAVIPVREGENNSEKLIKLSVPPLVLGLVVTIVALYHFKYYPTLAPFISTYFYIDPNQYANITVPLGISFITFSAISYFIDIYKNEATAGSFSDCLLYIFFFPKVVSGPIVLWKDFQPQIKEREATSLDSFIEGINLIAIGFAKKVILADTFGLYADQIKGQCIDTPTAWLGWILYAFQIYYDFAGYSDIAIGLSKMFGFNFKKNFDFPYRSLSITEFWRRWHISLGTFFRNYIYIPLGGNRKGFNRTLVNLFIVFLVTGIWHGSGMAYIIWGVLHGICIVIERIIKDKKWYQKIPKFTKWAAAFFITASAWQFFRYGGNGVSALAALGQLFGIHSSYTSADIAFPWQYYVNNKVIILLIIGFVGATLLGDKRVIAFHEKCMKNKVLYLIKEIVILCLLVVSITFMISSSYSPFIYFQF